MNLAQTMIKKKKATKIKHTHFANKHKKEKENSLTYPSFGEELETRVDIELSGLYFGFWGLWSRRRARNGIKMSSCLRIQKVCFVWKPWFMSWSCFWVWEAEQMMVKSRSSHSHWEREREREREAQVTDYRCQSIQKSKRQWGPYLLQIKSGPSVCA